jgi:predicted RNase H-like HicB family nuclease
MEQGRSFNIFGYVYDGRSKGDEVAISFPDFPGLEAKGKNVSDAENKAYRVLKERLDALAATGEPLPLFKRNFQIMKEQKEAFRAGKPFAVMAFILEPARPAPIRFNIIANEGEIARIDAAAEELGVSRSRFLIEAGLERAKVVRAKSGT